MKYRLATTALLVGVLLGLVLIPAEPGIAQGPTAGEEVVVSAQFLLDSESRLQEFVRKLMAESKEDKP